jgi:hypothetical protein
LHYYDIKNHSTSLQLADALLLRREPDNVNDELAIVILTVSAQKLGYLPKFRNQVLARLMDAGKSMVAEVTQLKAADNTASAYAPKSIDPTTIIDVRLRISLRE